VGGPLVAAHDRTTRASIVRAGEIVDHWVHTERAEPIADDQLALEGLPEIV
jgi:hypothetical protein